MLQDRAATRGRWAGPGREMMTLRPVIVPASRPVTTPAPKTGDHRRP